MVKTAFDSGVNSGFFVIFSLGRLQRYSVSITSPTRNVRNRGNCPSAEAALSNLSGGMIVESRMPPSSSTSLNASAGSICPPVGVTSAAALPPSGPRERESAVMLMSGETRPPDLSAGNVSNEPPTVA